MRFSWVQYTAFDISCNILEPFAVVVGHIVFSSVQHLKPYEVAYVLMVRLEFELLLLGALHKLPDIVRYLCAFFFGVAHLPVNSPSIPSGPAFCNRDGGARIGMTGRQEGREGSRILPECRDGEEHGVEEREAGRQEEIIKHPAFRWAAQSRNGDAKRCCR